MLLSDQKKYFLNLLVGIDFLTLSHLVRNAARAISYGQKLLISLQNKQISIFCCISQ